MGVGGAGSEGAAVSARVVGGRLREMRRMLISMGQGFGEGSIIEVRKEVNLGRMKCRCVRLISREKCGGCGGAKSV